MRALQWIKDEFMYLIHGFISHILFSFLGISGQKSPSIAICVFSNDSSDTHGNNTLCACKHCRTGALGVQVHCSWHTEEEISMLAEISNLRKKRSLCLLSSSTQFSWPPLEFP
jgi:hypothetical protein